MREKDYSYLKGRIRQLGLTQKETAHQIGIRESTFSLKLNGHSAFTQTEIQKLAELLRIPPFQIGKYFFTPKV